MTRKLNIMSVYLGSIVAKRDQYIHVLVLSYTDAEDADRKVVPSSPYRLKVRIRTNSAEQKNEAAEKMLKLTRGSLVILRVQDIERGMEISYEDIIIDTEPRQVTFAELVDELDERF